MNDKLTESVAYLKGLAEGMEIGVESKEGKLINAIIDIMGQFANVIQGIEAAHEELNDYVESIDDDLSDLESEILSNKDDDDDDMSDDDDDDDDFDANEYLSSLSFGKGMFGKSDESDDDDVASTVKRLYDDDDDDKDDGDD